MHLRACIVVVFVSLPAASAQTGGGCSPAGDTGIAFHEDVIRLLSEKDSAIVEARRRFYNVPEVGVADVVPIRDAATLGRARGGLAAYLQRAPSRCIYVLRLGPDHYAVFDPEYQVGHYQGVFIFDRKWRVVGGWTG
ncbi:hypothetical protein BH23GEM1_BH23GEM1_05380 [soil metagenome]